MPTRCYAKDLLTFVVSTINVVKMIGHRSIDFNKVLMNS